jgi:hypothetical protein
MLYDLECEYCGLISEHSMMSSEIDKRVECPHCGESLCRREHRIYDVPMIQGDTVAGSCNMSNYFDPGLNEFVRSRTHRKDLMRAQGLEEYSPDPEMRKTRDEVKHIRRNSPPGDPQAKAAIQKEYKTADIKRRTEKVKRGMAERFRKAGV